MMIEVEIMNDILFMKMSNYSTFQYKINKSVSWEILRKIEKTEALNFFKFLSHLKHVCLIYKIYTKQWKPQTLTKFAQNIKPYVQLNKKHMPINKYSPGQIK